ncbi:hypothetical protein ACIRPX_06340 [Streptomyces sp. NPDC101225]
MWTLDDVRGGSGTLLCRAVADGHRNLAGDGGPDHRIAVQLG